LNWVFVREAIMPRISTRKHVATSPSGPPPPSR
jgi:hypothetical protein